jgi:hypothetical protein
MHRNCHLGRAFSLLPRRRLGRMNAADPTNKEFSRFPNFGCGFDSHRRSRKIHVDSAALTHRPPLDLRLECPFCAQVFSERRRPQDEKIQEITG